MTRTTGRTTTTGFSTRAIHHGYNPADHQGALVPPIHTSATYAFPDVAYGARCFAGEEPGYFYTRIANPTLALLEGRIVETGWANACRGVRCMRVRHAAGWSASAPC